MRDGADRKSCEPGRKAVKRSVGTRWSPFKPGGEGGGKRRGISFARKATSATYRDVCLGGNLRRLSISLGAFQHRASFLRNAVTAIRDHGRRGNWTVNPAFDILTWNSVESVSGFYGARPCEGRSRGAWTRRSASNPFTQRDFFPFDFYSLNEGTLPA